MNGRFEKIDGKPVVGQTLVFEHDHYRIGDDRKGVEIEDGGIGNNLSGAKKRLRIAANPKKQKDKEKNPL
jgi:hypothetical protein